MSAVEGRTELVHATSVALRTSSGWCGVLLTGPSGAGKSDLALRLMERGWRLVADDYSRVWRSGTSIYAALDPGKGDRIAGLIEARGLGPVSVAPVRPLVRIGLVVRCRQAQAERLPDPATLEILGAPVPVVDVDVRPASAPGQVERALKQRREVATGL